MFMIVEGALIEERHSHIDNELESIKSTKEATLKEWVTHDKQARKSTE